MKSIFIDFQNINIFPFNGKIIAEFSYEVFDMETELRDRVTKQLIIGDDDMAFSEAREAAIQSAQAFQTQFMENQ